VADRTMIRAPRLPSSASRIVSPMRAASYTNSNGFLDPHPSQVPDAGRDAPLPLEALLGSWHICASTLPLWDSRRDVQANYAWPAVPQAPADRKALRIAGVVVSLAVLLSTPHNPLFLAPTILAFRRTRSAMPAFLLALALFGPSNVIHALEALLLAVLITDRLRAPAPLFLDEITSRPRQPGSSPFTPATLRGQNVWDAQRGGQLAGREYLVSEQQPHSSS